MATTRCPGCHRSLTIDAALCDACEAERIEAEQRSETGETQTTERAATAGRFTDAAIRHADD